MAKKKAANPLKQLGNKYRRGRSNRGKSAAYKTNSPAIVEGWREGRGHNVAFGDLPKYAQKSAQVLAKQGGYEPLQEDSGVRVEVRNGKIVPTDINTGG